MEAKAVQPTARDLYDLDFYEWIVRNAGLLRVRRFDEADIERIAEEIEDMGKREQRELVSRLEVLLAHLLKWQSQPGRRESRSWLNTITLQRSKIAELLEEMPSLRPALVRKLPRAYKHAVLMAGRESRAEAQLFPETCPFTLDQILDSGFFPD